MANNSKVMEKLSQLGRRVRDRVTGFEGVISSISFDLYGCICACINPGKDKDGNLQDCVWMDINRMEFLSSPVMEQPNYLIGTQAEGKQGTADKPGMRP